MTLAWDPNSEPDLAGYRVYYGTSSGNYTANINVGNVTTAAVPNLAEGTTYYFAVTAYNSSAVESLPSSEVFHTVTAPSGAAPTISDISDQTTPANTATPAIAFTVGDPDTALGSLIISGNSSNVALVPNENITFGGSGASRTVMVTPATGQAGTATITVSVSDGLNSVNDTFVLTVVPPNTVPTISNIVDQTIDEDAATGALAFTIGDAETAAGSLTLSGSSSNTALVPNGNITFGGSGANRTLTVTPTANQSGTATITLTVGDGALTASASFVLTVTAVNDVPTISTIADQAISANGTTGTLAFTVGDTETAPGSLAVSGTSTNLALVPDSNIVFGGSGANRTVTVTPVSGQTGSATIVLSVSDGSSNVTGTFVLTVSSLPTGTVTFSNTAAISVPLVGAATPNPSTINIAGMGGSISKVTVTLQNISHTNPDDLDVLLVGPAGQKVLIMSDAGGTGDLNNVTLILDDAAASSLSNNGQLSGGTFKPSNYDTNSDSFAAPAPAAPYATTLSAFNGQSAEGTWSLFVTDDASTNQGSIAGGWSLTVTTVTPAAQPPTISDIANQTTNEDTATAALAFTLADGDTALGSLTVSATSSNTALVPNGSITLGGTGANRTLTATPAANQTGTTTITVTVSDGALTASDTFVVTVTAVNDAPEISSIVNQTIVVNETTGALAFTVGDVETAAGSLTLSANSSNTALVPNGGIAFGGSGANRTLTATPAANQTGTTTITVTVSDGGTSVSGTFVVTVRPVNPPPQVAVNTQGGTISVQIAGLPGEQYTVEVSEDLQAWTSLAVVTEPSGSISIDDPAAAGRPRRFYRVRYRQ